MIGKITGKIEIINAESVLLDVNGVGYIINISSTTKNSLSSIGENVSLFTEMLVREDSIQLIGFASQLEKKWFGLLTSVQGVGAKAALAILGVVSLKKLSRSIALGDTDYITSAPGIGPKIAKRILLELGQKVLTLDFVDSQSSSIKTPKDGEGKTENSNLESDHEENKEEVNYDKEAAIISALMNLGYDKVTSSRAVAKVFNENEGLEISEIIRLSLQNISGK